jgi:hypothetical protein
MVGKLAQIPPEIWMNLPLEDKKWLLNDRKFQKQEDEKMKKSLALSKPTALSNDKETNNSIMPNQYARVKNVAKGEDVIKKIQSRHMLLLMNFLKKQRKVQVISLKLIYSCN